MSNTEASAHTKRKHTGVAFWALFACFRCPGRAGRPRALPTFPAPLPLGDGSPQHVHPRGHGRRHPPENAPVLHHLVPETGKENKNKNQTTGESLPPGAGTRIGRGGRPRRLPPVPLSFSVPGAGKAAVPGLPPPGLPPALVPGPSPLTWPPPRPAAAAAPARPPPRRRRASPSPRNRDPRAGGAAERPAERRK